MMNSGGLGMRTPGGFAMRMSGSFGANTQQAQAKSYCEFGADASA